ncbi:MAG: DUF2130 domain-containing protein [Bacteroidetes bacterium]|nr:DUF2130 domain-containing protein [Bacteroidota bacterium]
MADFIIHCPKCNHAFEPGDSIREEVQNELRGQMKEWQKQKEIETAALIEAEKKKMHAELENNLKKNIASEYEAQLQQFQKNAAEAEIKLNAARAKEVEFLQKEQSLKTKEAELELTLQRKLMEERGKLQEQLAKEEAEKIGLKEQEYALRTKELEKQIEDQKKLVEEMRRKQEQGSMQLQGEVQELMLEELLQTTFPFDKIEEVGKGVRGADCIQTVRNQFGSESGKIIYESKRTKDFANDWIEKLKSDMRTLGADVAIIVTQTLPKDMDRFGEKDGVYICTFTEVRSVALLLRNALLKIAEAKKSQENKGDKMVMLYDYLTSSEFSEQWKAIREGFMSMKLSIQKERDMMEKLWKSREKQLEKVLLNAAHIKGSVEGIAGADAVNLSITSSDDDALLLE